MRKAITAALVLTALIVSTAAVPRVLDFKSADRAMQGKVYQADAQPAIPLRPI